MRRIIVIALFALLALGSSLCAAGSVGSRVALAAASSQAPDPCGFRASAWTYVQFSADFIARVNDVSNDTDYPRSADAAFYKQGLRDAIQDMGADFGNPNGTHQLRYQLGAVMQFVGEALQGWENGTGSLQILSGKLMGDAATHQARAWHIVSSICGWKGKSTSQPVLKRLYDWDSTNSHAFTAPATWNIAYNYDCRANDGGTGSFLLTVRTGNNSLVATAANEEGSTGQGVQAIHHAGNVYLKIDSTCYWHIRAYGG